MSAWTILLGFFFATLACPASLQALALPPLNPSLNDFAGMMPEASVKDLQDRLLAFKTKTGHGVVVLTLPSLDNEEIEIVAEKAFGSLPLQQSELDKSILLLVARKDRRVTVYPGSTLRQLFPEPQADLKLQAHVIVYFDGFRPDLGIYAATHYIFRVITGEVKVAATTEEEKLEDSSTAGRGAGAIFALCLAPYLALVVGMLWGIYATQYRVQSATRLFIGAVLGGGTAKMVALLMVRLGNYGYDLWYFILALSVLLAGFGSLTEFWMAGDWCAIPTVKDKVKRKPEDNMGI
jgi:uncharacterized membrane protein YgcG